MSTRHDSSAESPTDDEQRRIDRKIFFPVTVAGAAVVLTLFVYVAALFGNAQNPVDLHPESSIQQSILTHGVPLILVETGLLVFVSVRAMAQDRRVTLERMKYQNEPDRNPQELRS